MKHLVAWLVWWICLWWLWMLIVGDWNHYEWIGGACAATVAATILEIARVRAGVHARVPLSSIAAAKMVLPQVLIDFGIVMWVLLKSVLQWHVVRGSYHARDFDAGGDDPRGVGHRAWSLWSANFSPNAVVIDIDVERNLSLVHDLIPNRPSEEPAA